MVKPVKVWWLVRLSSTLAHCCLVSIQLLQGIIYVCTMWHRSGGLNSLMKINLWTTFVQLSMENLREREREREQLWKIAPTIPINGLRLNFQFSHGGVGEGFAGEVKMVRACCLYRDVISFLVYFMQSKKLKLYFLFYVEFDCCTWCSFSKTGDSNSKLCPIKATILSS